MNTNFKVITYAPAKVQFDVLEPLETFEYLGDIYIKIPRINANGGHVNALRIIEQKRNIELPKYCNFSPENMVTPKLAEITIKDREEM